MNPELTEQQAKQIWSETDRYKGLQGESKRLAPEFFELLKSPQLLHLRKSTNGKYSVEMDLIKTGEPVTVVSERNWLMMGYAPQKVLYDCPRILNKLKKEGRLLMSDSPQEMFLQYDAYMQANGKVLVGGLGLGLYADMIAKKKNVTEVVVVEIDKDVIELCKPVNPKIRVIHGNVKDFIASTDEHFDFAYIDIHYSTGCMEYLQTVLPMRRIFERRFPSMPVYFWGEEEMKAQYNPNFDKEKG